MNNNYKSYCLSKSALIILLSLTFTGCASTKSTEEEPECRPKSAEECTVEEGDDRGYDPCLVNASLPVCKT